MAIKNIHWTRWVSCFALAVVTGLVSSCSDQSSDEVLKEQFQESLAKVTEPKFLQIRSVKQHNYVEADGGSYFYESALSEEDIYEGKGVGEITEVQYLGQDRKGFHKIRFLDGDRSSHLSAKCKNPCKLVELNSEFGSEKLPFNPNTIIGGVFEDIFNGSLMPSRFGSFLNEDEYDGDVREKYLRVAPNPLRCTWYREGLDKEIIAFSISDDGKSISIFENSDNEVVSDINIVKTTALDKQDQSKYEIFFNNNSKKVILRDDSPGQNVQGLSANGFISFTVKDCN